MRKDISKEANGYLVRNRMRRFWRRVVGILACIVVFCTTYALILPAITLENGIYCGRKPHQHGPECYEKVLICGQQEAETTAHVHSPECSAQPQLICENTDPEHQHTDECYQAADGYICGQEEAAAPAHRHTEDCYQSTLICDQEEHEHSLLCHSNPDADKETAEDWANSLSSVGHTGNWCTDLVALAESQLGYSESEQNYAVAEAETKKGYTRYGAWYGDPYGDWNAMFVSFCLNYAGIPEEVFPREASCSGWVQKLQSEEYGCYAPAASEYTPKAGDLVFLDGDGDGESDRVGVIVQRIEDQQGTPAQIKTVQGDAENQVQYLTYSIADETIMGYAALPDDPAQTQSDPATPAEAPTAENLDGKTLVIFNPAHNRALTATATSSPTGFLKAAEAFYNSEDNSVYAYPTSLDSDVSPDYQLWTFTLVEGYTDKYYITTTIDDAEKYLTIGSGSRGAKNVTLEDCYDDVTERIAKQVITVTAGSDTFAGKFRLTNEGGHALNKFYGKEYFGGWSEEPANLTNADEYFYLAVQGEFPKVQTIKGISPNGTVINVFDYWLLNQISTNAGGDFGEGNHMDSGINQGHALKFRKADADGIGTINTWTGVNGGPLKELVANTLGTDGYPKLTEYAVTNSDATSYTQESLAYLFDPNKANDYKQTFRNVGGLLQIDPQGYYFYDSRVNSAELNQETGQFTLYNGPGVNGNGNTDGQFFPLNQFRGLRHFNCTNAKVNHYFGLTMTCRFVQRYGGHTNSTQNIDTIFEFSGDDDVWIFIDGVLVGDLGGIHDRATVNINFATGDVTINGAVTTTLKAAFEAAGKGTTEEWNGDTFADNTYHTMKFFYLERGNYESNMKLKYNLTAVPATSISKTDQYGQGLPNVEFKAYRADSSWVYDDTKPLYTGTTDSTGTMTFVDEDKMPYTLKELYEMFGGYFVLKETKAPEGHRVVSPDVHLCINDRALWCENTYESGVWAMVNLQVSAPATLKLVNGEIKNFYEVTGTGSESTTVSHGTLFGIVLKRVGTGPISAQASWAPVSGNSKEGYTVYKVTTNDEFVQKAIDIAKEKDTVFTMYPSGAMELEMDNLPGHVFEYYYMLDESHKNDAEFTTAYYWTSEDSLEKATTENTFRVNADATGVNAFGRTFGADIEVPNLSNRLLVQKYNDSGELINGAIFALFRANEDGTYIAEDGTSVTLVKGQYSIEVHFDQENDHNSYALITTADGKTIKSIEQRMTNNKVLAPTPGTCAFGIRDKKLVEGCYYLMEVQAPEGHKINSTPVMVRVTDKAIYANAGTVGDGIEVARGPGYIVSTLHKAASFGDIDNTLTWIYQKLRVSQESHSFTEAVPRADTPGFSWEYAKKDGMIQTSYLRYDRSPQQLGEKNRFLANYEVDESEDRVAMEGTVRTHTQQIATDVGWSFNEIYQDFAYGNKKSADAKYTNLEGQNIYNLFSRSVYVRVHDEQETSNLEISKEVTGAPAEKKDTFTFTVTFDGAPGSYIYTVYPMNDRTDVLSTGTISNGGTITLKHDQVAVIRDLPKGAKYTVTETPLKNYNTSYSIDGGRDVTGFEAGGTLNFAEGLDGNRVSKVHITNAYNASPLTLTILKYQTGTTKPLSGAKFVLTTTTNSPKFYNKNGEWVTLGGANTETTLALTTGADGTIQFTGIPDGEYALKEIAAPAGYNRLGSEITFTVYNGKVTSADVTYTDSSVTVYNNTGHELPATGGIGTSLYTIGGVLLMTAAAMLLLYNKKKHHANKLQRSC